LKVTIGSIVEFERKQLTIMGKVQEIKQNSVIVVISENVASSLGYDTNLTVVNHKNYKILS